MKEELTIVKIGGNIIDEEHKLAEFIKAFSNLKGQKILVHGGGKIATKLAAKLGIEVKMMEGRRITDDAMIDVVIMTYAGFINKKLVASLNAKDVRSLGLTGADADVIRSMKRPVNNGVDYGWVGDILSVNVGFLADVLSKNLVPVMAPLTVDATGQLLNTNADTIASELASSLVTHFEISLNYVFELKGLMQDIKDSASLIKSINRTEYQNLKKEGVITDGMVPKLDNAFSTLDRGVQLVRILDVVALSHLNNPQYDEYTVIH